MKICLSHHLSFELPFTTKKYFHIILRLMLHMQAFLNWTSHAEEVGIGEKGKKKNNNHLKVPSSHPLNWIFFSSISN
jgi:hypothetical protein